MVNEPQERQHVRVLHREVRSHELSLVNDASPAAVIRAAREAALIVATAFGSVLLFDGRDLDAASGHGHGGGNRAQYPRNLGSRGVGVDSRHGSARHSLRYLHAHLLLSIFVLHGGKFFLLLFFEFLALSGVLADLFNFAVVPLGDRVFLLLLLGRE